MSRMFSEDIRDLVIDILTNGKTDGNGIVRRSLKDQLTFIDIERTSETPSPKTISYKWSENQLPYVLVNVEKSDIIQDETMTADLEATTEVFDVIIMFVIKDRTNEVQNYIERYIQASLQVLNGYVDSDVTWMLPTESDRGNLYQDKQQYTKTGMVRVAVRVN